MAQQIITFDPDVAVPYGVNLTIFSGADFNTTFTIKTSAGSSIDFSNYTGKSNMKKSAIGTANTFGVTLGDTNGRAQTSRAPSRQEKKRDRSFDQRKLELAREGGRCGARTDCENRAATKGYAGRPDGS